MKITFRGGPKDGMTLDLSSQPTSRFAIPIVGWDASLRRDVPTDLNVLFCETVYELGSDGDYHHKEMG